MARRPDGSYEFGDYDGFKRELDSIFTIERGYAAYLTDGGNDTEEARAHFMRGSDPHWQWAWEWAARLGDRGFKDDGHPTQAEQPIG